MIRKQIRKVRAFSLTAAAILDFMSKVGARFHHIQMGYFAHDRQTTVKFVRDDITHIHVTLKII